jgi:hypothetical protein
LEKGLQTFSILRVPLRSSKNYCQEYGTVRNLIHHRQTFIYNRELFVARQEKNQVNHSIFGSDNAANYGCVKGGYVPEKRDNLCFSSYHSEITANLIVGPDTTVAARNSGKLIRCHF